MNLLIQEHQQLLLSLIRNRVNFIIIGGYAVIYYGYERVTGDIDIWLEPDNKNMPPLLEALREFNIEEQSLHLLSKIDLTKPQVFFVGETPRRVDFITVVNNISFREAIAQVNFFSIENQQVPVIHYNHLILTKITTGRAKDKADIEVLQNINKYRKKE